MAKYFVSRLSVKNLWGQRDFDLVFNKDINILIGPNASGKTTLLNILRFVLTADILSLSEIEFERVLLHLTSFKRSSQRYLQVVPTKTGFDFTISPHKRPYSFELEPQMPYRTTYSQIQTRRIMQQQAREFLEIISDMVPAVWLPVSRRLPIPWDEDEAAFQRPGRRQRLESVDECLKDLIKELSTYRLRLDAQLSDRYKEFQRRLFDVMLYSKEHDEIRLEPPRLTQGEKEQLLSAFEVAGLLDEQMTKRINEHFLIAEQVRRRISKAKAKRYYDIDDVLITPLIQRTKSMIKFAGALEKDRQKLFAPLRRYEEIVNSFLNKKSVEVMDNGILKIESSFVSEKSLKPENLSSGEKQILILLTQALLSEAEPVIYVVDEPDLSLHVSWQEKLLDSLLSLGNEIQVIAATHSPDIVGPFQDRVIDLGKVN